MLVDFLSRMITQTVPETVPETGSNLRYPFNEWSPTNPLP